MTITLLCPGPSLEKFPGSDTVKIGVNRAAVMRPCDWWCASDYPLIRDYDPIGKPRLFTNENKVNRPERFSEILFKEQIWKLWPSLPENGPWSLFTAPSALILAAYLGATDIQVWGCDFKGTSDADGHQYQWDGIEAWRTRFEGDWSQAPAGSDALRAVECWHKTVAWLESKNIRTTRNGLT